MDEHIINDNGALMIPSCKWVLNPQPLVFKIKYLSLRNLENKDTFIVKEDKNTCRA